MSMWSAKSIVKINEDGVYLTGQYSDVDFVPFQEIDHSLLEVVENHTKKTLQYIKKIRQKFKKAHNEKHSIENNFE